jgi:hypothetical protein
MRVLKFLLPNKTTDGSVIVVGISQNFAERVFLNPVQLEKSKWLAIKATYQGNTMFLSKGGLKELFLLGLSPLHNPVKRNSSFVHPFVE